MSAALASNLNTVVPLAANDNFTTQSRSFDYDNVGRLTGADGPLKCMEGTASYSYDAVGNLHSKSFMENGAPSRTVTNRYDTVKNRVTTTEDDGPNGDRALHYDSHGNVYKLGTMRPCRGLLRVCSVPRTEYLATPTRFKVYDRTDQPAALYGRAANGERTVGDYIYDGNPGTFALRPLLKVLETVQAKPDFRESLNANGPERAKSIVNGEVIYNVYDASGSLVHVDIRPRPDGNGGTIPGSKTDYIPGPLPWPSAPILCPPDIKFGCANRLRSARIKTDDAGTSTVTYMHDDHLKSASLATKGDGTIAWAESYTPFGETLLNPAANDNQGGFTGHIKDKATGLNYMQARYYDPNMGRFLSIDPVTFLDKPYPGQFNRYAYTWNDPINANDPDGEFLNFVAKFVVDVGLEVAIQAATGQEIDLGAAAKGAALGVLDPTKTARKAAKLAGALNDVRKANKVCCFVAGTLVETKDGLRPIENIEVGDLVWARDEESGEEALKPVLGLIRLHDRVIWDLETVSETGETHTFGTTDDHPWWVDGHGWKRTDELSPKDILVTQTGEKVSILSVTNTNVIEPTFNFEVADFNTYFVGESKVWVHNSGANCDLTKRAANVARSKELGVPDSQIGPSGKPKQHTVNHSSRKSSTQAAKKEADRAGGSVRNDANPANPKQGPHSQATDAAGYNVKPVVHHERPRR